MVSLSSGNLFESLFLQLIDLMALNRSSDSKPAIHLSVSWLKIAVFRCSDFSSDFQDRSPFEYSVRRSSQILAIDPPRARIALTAVVSIHAPFHHIPHGIEQPEIIGEKSPREKGTSLPNFACTRHTCQATRPSRQNSVWYESPHDRHIPTRPRLEDGSPFA